jgi:hypothetical protein
MGNNAGGSSMSTIESPSSRGEAARRFCGFPFLALAVFVLIDL